MLPEPTITVTLNGVVNVAWANASVAPVGLDVKPSDTVFGCRSTLVVVEAPGRPGPVGRWRKGVVRRG